MNSITLNASPAVLALASFSLSDGTPVTFSKITTKDRIQVRLPDSHPFSNGDPLKIFGRDGRHYKNLTDLTLLVAPSAADAPAAAPTAAAPTSAEDVYFEVMDVQFATLADAKAEAISLLDDDNDPVVIYAVTRRKVGSVGFTAS